jgi:hypothetical protein
VVDKEQIEKTLKSWAIVKSTVWITNEGTVSVAGSVQTRHRPNPSGEIPVTFDQVDGHFDAFDNNLTTLKNAPRVVGKDFNVVGNELTSLQGMPQKIGGMIAISANNLTSLEGCVERVKGDFICNSNLLTDLVGGPKVVEGSFQVAGNPLTSLVGFPTIVVGVASLTYNPNLALLRTLVAGHIGLDGPTENHMRDANLLEVEHILNKYAGEGKRGVIRCQKELIAAGFEGNAKW